MHFTLAVSFLAITSILLNYAIPNLGYISIKQGLFILIYCKAQAVGPFLPFLLAKREHILRICSKLRVANSCYDQRHHRYKRFYHFGGND